MTGSGALHKSPCLIAGPVPMVRSLPAALVAAALCEVKAHWRRRDREEEQQAQSSKSGQRLFSGSSKIVEIGCGFAQSRALLKLRKKHSEARVAKRAWQMQCATRYKSVRPFADFPQCQSVIRTAVEAFDLPGRLTDDLCDARANVIVRHYEPGDFLGRHVDDFRMFKEPVLSCVLQAGGADDGLLLSTPQTVECCAAAVTDATSVGASGLRPCCCEEEELGRTFRVQEAAGTSVCLERDARYVFGHEIPRVAEPRISMTWRWFRDSYAGELREVLDWLDSSDKT
eukprot:TRINITY_DN20328_c0_g1_i2.p1 TRINITY_DN20328_c0_g1~~TRINITY_DN20328_c0_g1_i2.p1  ORF type:complete len:285 (-),score=44.13 TRINITY_DN20328_c0_g1_i2:9-863(-)